MKKIIGIFLIMSVLIGVASCNAYPPPPDLEQSEVSEKSDSDQPHKCGEEAEELKKEIEKLENKISTLQTKLDAAHGTVSEKEDQILVLESELSSLKNQLDGKDGAVTVKTVQVGYDYKNHGMVYAYVIDNYADNSSQGVVIRGADGAKREVLRLEHGSIHVIAANSDGSKIIMNDYEFEKSSTVWIYDIDKNKIEKLSLNIPDGKAVSEMAWFDDRYVLLTVQSDAGTAVAGGDIWIYDSKTNEHKCVIKSSDNKFQTSSCIVPGDSNIDFIIFDSVLWDDTLNFSVTLRHVVSSSKIMSLYNDGKTLDLSKEEELK